MADETETDVPASAIIAIDAVVTRASNQPDEIINENETVDPTETNVGTETANVEDNIDDHDGASSIDVDTFGDGKNANSGDFADIPSPIQGNDNLPITSDMIQLSDAPLDTPPVFSDYFFHTGPLRADPSPLMEWPTRIPDSQANPNLTKKYQSQLKDYKMLSESNRRARKYKQQAFSLLCMAIIYDNCRKWKKAISCYKQYIQIIESLFNQQQPNSNTNTHASMNELNELLYPAYNGLGVNYQLLATNVSNVNNDSTNINTNTFGSLTTIKTEQSQSQSHSHTYYFSQSLINHLKYRDCMININENSGMFIAYTNLGLLLLRCHSPTPSHYLPSDAEIQKQNEMSEIAIGNGIGVDTFESLNKLALNQFKHSLRYSILIESNIAQAIAICNIGNCYITFEDSIKHCIKARACQERYLQLTTFLHDYQSQAYAFHNLAKVINKLCKLKDPSKEQEIDAMKQDSKYFYTQAIKAAKYIGDSSLANQLKMTMAISTMQL